MADANSDDDLVIIGETRFSQPLENVVKQQVSNVLKSDDGSEECQILDDQQSEGEDLIVLDSIENGTLNCYNSRSPPLSPDDNSDSEQLEVVAEVPNNNQHSGRSSGDLAKQFSELQNKIKMLEEENSRLKDELKEPTIEIELGNDPSSIKLIINDAMFSRKYRSAIEKFISNLVSTKKSTEKDADVVFFDQSSPEYIPPSPLFNPVSPDYPPPFSSADGGPISPKYVPNSPYPLSPSYNIVDSSTYHPYSPTNNSQSPNNSSNNKNFFVDNGSASKKDKTSDTTESWSIPLYEQNYKEPLKENTESKVETNKVEAVASSAFGGACFNCGGNHLISACEAPHNRKAIADNKRLFMKNQAAKISSKRYHLSTEFHDLKPGEISEDLRSALGLRPNQLPLYIYRMRVLGYPPGWLKEAEIESSGIALYDSDGKMVVDDETVEDGELDLIEIKVQHDRGKLVSFPGFNVPVPRGFSDESHSYGLPSYRTHQSKKEMEKRLKPLDCQKKRKSSHSHSSKNHKKQKIEEMEVDEEIELLSGPPSLIRIPLPSETTPSRANSPSDSTTKSKSPSLTDLEDAKQKLMRELAEAAVNSSQESSSTELEKDNNDQSVEEGFSVIDSVGTDTEEDSEEETSNNKTVENGETSKEDIALNAANNTPTNHSISIRKGTPVVESCSPFSKLPDSASFARDIAEHIPFENLPSSTGSYDKMREVLSKVRDRVRHQSD